MGTSLYEIHIISYHVWMYSLTTTLRKGHTSYSFLTIVVIIDSFPVSATNYMFLEGFFLAPMCLRFSKIQKYLKLILYVCVCVCVRVHVCV